MTEQNRRDEAAQPTGAAQSGQSQTEPARQPGPPNGTGADASDTANASGDKPEQPFVVRDKRRKPSPKPRSAASPDGGQPATAQPSGANDTAAGAAAAAEAPAAGGGTASAKPGTTEDKSGGFAAELQALRSDLDERTKDLQRITAEYANYRRRVERDRRLAAEQSTAATLSELLGVLDDLDRARSHGDLVGPFGAVAEQLTSVLGKLGLSPFGEKGDAFDPTRHEAVAHSVSAEVSEPTCVEVFRRGYLYGERLLRPALVAVADPSDEEPGTTEAPAETTPAEAGQEPTVTPEASTGPAAAAGSADESSEGPAAAESPGGQPAAAGQSGGADAGSSGATGSHNEKPTGDA